MDSSQSPAKSGLMADQMGHPVLQNRTRLGFSSSEVQSRKQPGGDGTADRPGEGRASLTYSEPHAATPPAEFSGIRRRISTATLEWTVPQKNDNLCK